MTNQNPAVHDTDAPHDAMKRAMFLAASRVTRHHAEKFEARLASARKAAPAEPPPPVSTPKR